MIDTTTLPSLSIDLGTLIKASEIKHIIKEAGYKRFVYSFIHKSKIMKYGAQFNTSTNKLWGDRIYRQAFHIPGWPTECSENMSGNDMRDIIRYFPSIHKMDVCIVVWDMTSYPSAHPLDPDFEVKQLERQFIKAHIDKFGEKPVGNIKDESHMDTKFIVTNSQFNNLFEVVQ